MEEFFAEAPAAPVAERVRLGRWLFDDRRLSRDGTVACATCHRPTHAFSEPLPVSIGIGGARARRKAPTLLNLAARTTLVDTPERDRGERYFWDGRVTALEAQVLVPIADPAEMGSTIAGCSPVWRRFGATGRTSPRRSGRRTWPWIAWRLHWPTTCGLSGAATHRTTAGATEATGARCPAELLRIEASFTSALGDV
jgi:cytochrome c peroxidase